MYKYTNTQMHKYTTTNTHVHKYTSTQIQIPILSGRVVMIIQRVLPLPAQELQLPRDPTSSSAQAVRANCLTYYKATMSN